MMFVTNFISKIMLMICSSANSRKQGAGIIICTLFFCMSHGFWDKSIGYLPAFKVIRLEIFMNLLFFSFIFMLSLNYSMFLRGRKNEKKRRSKVKQNAALVLWVGHFDQLLLIVDFL